MLRSFQYLTPGKFWANTSTTIMEPDLMPPAPAFSAQFMGLDEINVRALWARCCGGL